MSTGGAGGTTSQTSTQAPNPALQPLYGQTAEWVQALQPQIAGQMTGMFGPQVQQIPGFTLGQTAIEAAQQQRAFGQPLTGYEQQSYSPISQVGQQNTPEQAAWLTAMGATGYTAPEQAALQQIGQITGGPLGQSPATKAAMAAARTPVLNDLAQAGLGNSDAIASALGGVYAPILAQEMQSRAAMVPQLASIGQQQAGRGFQLAGLESQLGQALRGGQTTQAQLLQQLGGTEAQRQSALLSEYGQTEEAVRQIQAQQQQAYLNDIQRRQGLGTQFTTGILSGFPSLTSTSTIGQTKQAGAK